MPRARAFNTVRVISVTMLVFSALAAVLIIVSYRRPLVQELFWRGEVCRVRLVRGTIVADNKPEIDLESGVQEYNTRRWRKALSSSVELHERISALYDVNLRYLERRLSEEEGMEVWIDTSSFERKLAGLRRNLSLLKPYANISPAWSFTLRWWPRGTCLALAIPAVAIGLRNFWRHGKRGNVCVTCSYDLTGNISGVCPECGGKIAEGR